jgi:hypothetical protein
VRKEGVEPSRELPHRNLNPQADDVGTRNHEDRVRQETSENASERHLSGRSGPKEELLELLKSARDRFESEGGVGRLRRDLLRLLSRAEELGNDAEG